MPGPRVRRAGLALLLAAVLAAAVVVGLTSSSSSSGGRWPPVQPVPAPVADPAWRDPAHCAALADLSLPEVVAIEAALVTTGTADGESDLPELCRVYVTVDPAIHVAVYLPTRSYNGRFQAVGGGGFAGIVSWPAMAGAARDGYATASTDTGHSSAPEVAMIDGSFALAAPGELDDQRIEDFAARSLVQLTEKAEALVAAFYGTSASYAYWNGCSTGGRQGLLLAQRLPDGYDGVLAGAPAIDWDRFVPAELWPQVVMQQELGGPIAPCKLDLATAAAVEACDDLDGVTDGVLDDPRRCDFDPATLVGRETGCGEFTAADARVVAAIWRGPRAADGSRLWFGLQPGTPLELLAGPEPFGLVETYTRYWVEQDPDFDWHRYDLDSYRAAFATSRELFGDVLASDDPDLSAFRDAGGRLLLWHGWSDELIPAEGTIDYLDRVADALGGAAEVGEFARLFLAPGVGHCGGGAGPQPDDPFAALVAWVERGEAPDRLPATLEADGAVVRTRPLCPYPQVAEYDGSGDPDVATSFDCEPGTGR